MDYRLFDRKQDKPLAKAEGKYALAGMAICLEQLGDIKAGMRDISEVPSTEYWDWELRDETGTSLFFRIKLVGER